MKKSTTENTPDNMDFFEKERALRRRNKKKNIPISIMSIAMLVIFIGMSVYLVRYIVFDSKTVIADAGNKRQDINSDRVIRGDIITSDEVTIATSTIDGAQNEYRTYPYGKAYCHIAGYNKYGRAGIELSENFTLLSSNEDILKKIKKTLKWEKLNGDTVVTTLNHNLQMTAYNALNGNKGAVIVIKPSTGEILALVSSPGFDPNDIDTVWDYVHSDEGQESTILLNRVSQGLYAPGSTFKIITALEFIRENSDSYMNYNYNCTSSGIFNDVSIHCAGNTAHGTLTLPDAIAYSCNTAFSDIGTKLNMSSYRDLTEELLFNSELPFDGYYKESVFELDKESDPSIIPQTVIGQGNTEITPLHNAMIISAIANNGVLMKPYYIDSIRNADKVSVKKYGPESYDRLISKDEAKLLTEYMKGVCDRGTASGYFAYTAYRVAGKTGTAEYDNEGNCNSWFIGFSNPDDPDIAVSVIVEDYTSNQMTGAYVAKCIFDAYYANPV